MQVAFVDKTSDPCFSAKPRIAPESEVLSFALRRQEGAMTLGFGAGLENSVSCVFHCPTLPLVVTMALHKSFHLCSSSKKRWHSLTSRDYSTLKSQEPLPPHMLHSNLVFGMECVLQCNSGKILLGG